MEDANGVLLNLECVAALVPAGLPPYSVIKIVDNQGNHWEWNAGTATYELRGLSGNVLASASREVLASTHGIRREVKA